MIVQTICSLMYTHHARKGLSKDPDSLPCPSRATPSHICFPESPILIHKLLMKLRNPPNPLGPGRQKGRPEMQSPLLLPKPTPRHNTNPRRIQQLQTIKIVRILSSSLRLLNRLRRQRDLGEEIHGALWRLAFNALHFAESGVEGLGAGAEVGEDLVVFGLVEVVGG